MIARGSMEATGWSAILSSPIGPEVDAVNLLGSATSAGRENAPPRGGSSVVPFRGGVWCSDCEDPTSRGDVGPERGSSSPARGGHDVTQGTSSTTRKTNAVTRAIPILGWLPQYKRTWLAPDLLAGLSVWALVVPQALSYAAVVGVPTQYGLYTILGAAVLYAVFASTRQVVTGPSASVAAVTAPVAALYVASSSPDYVSTVIAL